MSCSRAVRMVIAKFIYILLPLVVPLHSTELYTLYFLKSVGNM